MIEAQQQEIAMNNADMPAMPVSDVSNFRDGFTKREMIAMSLPHAEMEINPQFAHELIGREINWDDKLDIIKVAAEIEAIQRVMRADALLAELDKCQKT